MIDPGTGVPTHPVPWVGRHRREEISTSLNQPVSSQVSLSVLHKQWEQTMKTFTSHITRIAYTTGLVAAAWFSTAAPIFAH